MTERKPHPDNALIDELQADASAPSQGDRSGGGVNRDVGTRSELRNTVGTTGNEHPRAQDHPEAMNEAKGEKTIGRLDPANKGPSSNSG
jgi:hypothetical protein